MTLYILNGKSGATVELEEYKYFPLQELAIWTLLIEIGGTGWSGPPFEASTRLI